MIAPWFDSLPHHHLNPGIDPEQFIRPLMRHCRFAEQSDSRGDAVGDRHIATTTPERRIVSIGELVVHDQEIAHMLPFPASLIVEPVRERRCEAIEGEQLDQPRHPDHDQVDAGGFERLQESARQAQRNAIALPRGPKAGSVSDQPRIEQRRAVDQIEQQGPCGVVAHVSAGKDQAVADAVLQGDSPAPPRLMRDRARVRHRRAGRFGLHCERAVGRKPLAPVLERGIHRPIDQQRAKAGAIDEQVSFDPNARIEHQRVDQAAFGILRHIDDLAFNPRDAGRLCKTAKESGVGGRIEMIGVGERRFRRCRELA